MGKFQRNLCYFDIAIKDKPAGRVILQLFNDVCPKTAENFKCLCTGEMGLGKMTGKPLHYKGTKFHRIVKSFMIQCGDFSQGNGRGGESIWGGTFEDENFHFKHDRPFLLSMANRGKNTNGSQFFITTQAAPHLNGVHVVFGEVIEGQELITSLENTPVDSKARPQNEIIISDCGVITPEPEPEVVKEKKVKKRKKHKASDSEAASDDSDKSKKKKKPKKQKKHKKEKSQKPDKQLDSGEVEEYDAPQCSVRPEEVPEIPEHNFLSRDMKKEETEVKRPRERIFESKAIYSKSGRIIRGRGQLRYRTPPRSRSRSRDRFRSRSATPEHWRAAESKPFKKSNNRHDDRRPARHEAYRDRERNRYDRERRGRYREENHARRSRDREVRNDSTEKRSTSDQVAVDKSIERPERKFKEGKVEVDTVEKSPLKQTSGDSGNERGFRNLNKTRHSSRSSHSD